MKNYTDAVIGVSCYYNEPPISFFESSAGRLRDVSAMIGNHVVSEAAYLFGTM